ncbi:aspartate-semialdehyde dehydrogenase [candidate division KSB1 bacterium]|nr:aspartate-semialdehyde dehydrogenase [candidate division KSB1 bacterium]
MNKINCAVLGATGVVGQHFLKLLVAHPTFEVTAICASDARAGKKLSEMKEVVPGGIPQEFADLVFDPMDVDILASKNVQVIFSGLPADVARDVESNAAQNGIKVFSNAGSHRMDADVPILIPEINHYQIELLRIQQQKKQGFIACNANCTTTGLTMALLPFIDLNIKRMVVASYQAVSGAGYPGLPVMDISNNVIPYINNEEPKVCRETGKIFGHVENGTIIPREWEIFAHCIRVPTIVGHMISVHLELDGSTDYDTVAGLIRNYLPPAEVAGLPTAPEKPVLFTEQQDRPQPRYDVDLGTPERAKGMAVIIGRLEVNKNIVRFVTLSNNLVRGAAGGSVLNAELAYRLKLI